MNKRNEIIWCIFGVLLIGSAVCVGWAFHVYNLIPTLVHDTLHGVGQLNDAQREALYPALLKAYRPIVFGCAAALAAWMIFVVFVLRLLKPPAAPHDHAA